MKGRSYDLIHAVSIFLVREPIWAFDKELFIKIFLYASFPHCYSNKNKNNNNNNKRTARIQQENA